MKVFARNFRGFKRVEVDIEKINFLLGDNSSGKTSILHLVSSVLASQLSSPPRLDENFGVKSYDYFSPFFENSDVTFGFRSEESEKFIAKLITVKRSRDRKPKVVKVTYVSSDNAISLKRTGDSILLKKEKLKDQKLDSLYDAHDKNEKFRKMAVIPRGIDLSEPAVFIISAHRDDADNDLKQFEKIFSYDFPDFSLLGPTRSLPEKYYNFDRKVHASGRHFASMWRDLERGRLAKFNSLISRFGKEGKIFDSFQVKPVSIRLPDSPMLVSVNIRGKEFTLDQVGVGISQVAPILAETLFSAGRKSERIGLFQQPELHLHPIAQAALGSFFYKIGKEGFRGIFETHSAFLIDRYRAELRDDEDEGKECPNILFCESLQDCNHLTTINVDPDGKLLDAPDAYHAFFVDELMRTMF